MWLQSKFLQSWWSYFVGCSDAICSSVAACSRCICSQSDCNRGGCNLLVVLMQFAPLPPHVFGVVAVEVVVVAVIVVCWL